jgi:hypothetical protein
MDENNLVELERITHLNRLHIPKFIDYAKDRNVLLAIRDLNPSTSDKINEIGAGRYAGKDLHMKLKSSIIPEIGGYIPVKNRFAKKEDLGADKKVEEILNADNSDYKTVSVTKVVTESNQDTSYTLCYDANIRENIFYYRDEENGKYYSAMKNGDEVDTNGKRMEDVKVLADRSGRILIPDYDLAIIGDTLGDDGGRLQNYAGLHEDYGRIPLAHKDIIENLRDNVTDNMVRHGSDNFNPVSYKFEMSRESPYTCFLPNGDVGIAFNPQEYLDIINYWRDADKNPMKQSYDLVLNPRLGVEVNPRGELYLPEKKFNWEKLDSEMKNLESNVKNFERGSPAYRAANDMAELNKVIINQYEKIKRTEMQEIYFKDRSDYDAWRESLRNAREGLDYMKSQYEMIYNEKPLITRYQNERRLVDVIDGQESTKSKLQKSYSISSDLFKVSDVNNPRKRCNSLEENANKGSILNKVKSIFKNVDVSGFNKDICDVKDVEMKNLKKWKDNIKDGAVGKRER